MMNTKGSKYSGVVPNMSARHPRTLSPASSNTMADFLKVSRSDTTSTKL